MRNKKLIIIFSVLCVLTLLVVLNSVIFSVQNVSAYCMNTEDSELEQMVLQKHNIKRGKSIFLLNENNVIKDVESAVSNIKVINIERKFPNSVYINYVKLIEYLKIDYNGNSYFCSNEGKIVRIAEGGDSSTPIIKLKLKGSLTSLKLSESFQSDNPNDLILVTSILWSLERLGFVRDVVDFLSFIDISKNFIYLKTTTGVFIELQSGNDMLNKLNYAISTYNQLSVEMKKTGTIIISDAVPIKPTYDPDDRYNGKI